MKRLFFILTLAGTLFSLTPAWAAPESKADTKTKETMLDRLCPQPKEAEFFEGNYLLEPNARVAITTEKELSEAEKSEIRNIFFKYWKFAPLIDFSKKTENANLGDEGYLINIGSFLSIDGKDATGVKQSLKTLRQLAEASRNGDGFVFQNARIKDFATLKFRGIHLCIFPETTIEQLEKYIRLASYYKFNYVVIEPWGVFPYKSHPEFAYADKKLDPAKFKKIINLCYELGITPIPQVSVLGHGTQSRISTAKHAVLANHPELENIFELYGWSYCMTSKKAEKILKDLLAEIYEFYGKPPFFHIGCDEAYDMGTCYSCSKQNITELLTSHLVKFNKYVNSLGARTIIWHDMLLDRADPRWKNHVAMGNAEMAKALETLPKNIIIADWQYSYQDKNQMKFATPKHFKDAGHDVIVCPWEVNKGILALAKTAKDDNLFGFLETTWHHLYGTKRFFSFFYASGDAAWNGGAPLRDTGSVRMGMPMLKHLWQIGSDMKDIPYEANGNSEKQISTSLSNR